MFTRLSRANRLVLDSFCTLSQTGKIIWPSVTTLYDGTSREQGRCSRLVNLVNAIGTGCDDSMKSKAPQANQRLRGSETRGSFRPLQATRLGKNATSAPTAAARESPGAAGSLARQGPGAVVALDLSPLSRWLRRNDQARNRASVCNHSPGAWVSVLFRLLALPADPHMLLGAVGVAPRSMLPASNTFSNFPSDH